MLALDVVTQKHFLHADQLAVVFVSIIKHNWAASFLPILPWAET